MTSCCYHYIIAVYYCAAYIILKWLIYHSSIGWLHRKIPSAVRVVIHIKWPRINTVWNITFLCWFICWTSDTLFHEDTSWYVAFSVFFCSFCCAAFIHLFDKVEDIFYFSNFNLTAGEHDRKLIDLLSWHLHSTHCCC